jgi:hypothetical protein
MDPARPQLRIDTPANAAVLTYLQRFGRVAPLVDVPGRVPDPYYQAGCHPDVVERLWDVLGAGLTRKCRRLVCGTPALVHPKTGVVFGLGLGTQYGLRLPGELAGEAVRRGARTTVRWAGGGELETTRDLGADWVLGGYFSEEVGWMQQAFAVFSAAP